MNMSVYRKLFIGLCLFALLSACEKIAITAGKDSPEKKSVGANETVTVLMPNLSDLKNEKEMTVVLDRAKSEYEAK
ncbi:MAG: hypothetical protein K0R75_3602, partial [Paenibacillaceae bacterium]|nr:hypothetical protein [Paenibacillaceae bacterium]